MKKNLYRLFFSSGKSSSEHNHIFITGWINDWQRNNSSINIIFNSVENKKKIQNNHAIEQYMKKTDC